MLSKESRKKLETLVFELRKLLLDSIQENNEARYSFYLKGSERDKLKLSSEVKHSYDALVQYSRQTTGDFSLRYPEESVLESLYLEKAYSIANRIFLLKRLEGSGVQRLPVFSGESSAGYTQFRELFGGLCAGEDNGYDFLFRQFSDYYATELPSLFGENKILQFITYKSGVILEIVRRLQDVSLVGIWKDDTSIGWMYQYWNDPDRTRVNQKVSGAGAEKGKIEKHEIPFVTQLFTERYMVEWLLQNSLGVKWLAICQKNGWTPSALTVVQNLESRRAIWRKKLESGEVSKDAAMPLEEREEHLWKYYISQEIPGGVVETSVDSILDLKLLDPANGSGHFLLQALRMMFAFAKEESVLQKKPFSALETLKKILEDCLYGVDIDNRATQLAGAGLYITAKEILLEEGVDPSLLVIDRLNLVATNFSLGKLSPEETEVQEFKKDLQQKTGLSSVFVEKLFRNLQEADSLGSLLQISEEIRNEVASEEQDKPLFYQSPIPQGDVVQHTRFAHREDLIEKVYNLIDTFISQHDTVNDLGIQNMAKQLGRGLRLLQILDGKYDIVVTNPPYLGLAKMNSEIQQRIEENFPEGKADLYATFFLLYQKFTKLNGIISTVTMHGWMFISQFLSIRNKVLDNHYLYKCSHLGSGAFDAIGGEVTAVGMYVFINQQVTDKDISYFQRLVNVISSTQKDLALVCPLTKYQFQIQQSSFQDIPGAPMIYWWTEEFRAKYHDAEKVGENVEQGFASTDNTRYLRQLWESDLKKVEIIPHKTKEKNNLKLNKWRPYLKGSSGKRWFEAVEVLVKWFNFNKEKHIHHFYKGGGGAQSPSRDPGWFNQGIAFSYIGTNDFLCRLRKYKSIFDVSGSSIFINNPEKVQVSLSSKISGYVSQSINPTINNQVGDIQHLPIFPVPHWETYFQRAEALYETYFASKETCIEFQYPTFLSEEEFQTKECLIRSDIDREVYKNFSEDTIRAIQEEVGVSVGMYPTSTSPQIRWEGRSAFPTDLGEVHSKSPFPQTQAEYDRDRISYFSDIYLNGPYKFLMGEILLKKDGSLDRGDLQEMEELCHEFQIPPRDILLLKEKLGLSRHTDRQAESFYHLSFALGVLLGRFHRSTGRIVGVEVEEPEVMKNPLVYLSSLGEMRISIGREIPRTDSFVIQEIYEIIREKNPQGAEKILREMEENLLFNEERNKREFRDLNEYLREKAFSVHKTMYSNRPIYFPLSSKKRNFVVWTCLHTWDEGTLPKILADFLEGDFQKWKARTEALSQKYTEAGISSTEKNQVADELKKGEALTEELEEFIQTLRMVYEKGPNPVRQEVQAVHRMDLDDGVMVNSAALYPLLVPQWKEPAKWWGYLESPKGKHDFDWSHLAMRYYPKRVFAKVKKDPSLAVAHSDYGEYAGRDLLKELHKEYAKKWEEMEARSTTAEGEESPKKAVAKKKSTKKKGKKEDPKQMRMGL